MEMGTHPLTGFRYLVNRQPAKALPYFLRLRRSDVFDLIREHNLFTSIQDQVLLLIEFDRARSQGGLNDEKHGTAIQLLVDHTHSIPVGLRLLARLTTLDRPRGTSVGRTAAVPLQVLGCPVRERSFKLPTF